MDKDYLILKRASASQPSGEWNDEDYDVLAEGVVVGRIFKANASPVGASWMWTLAFGHHEDRSPTHGYEPTREAAMAAFAKSWRREHQNDDARHCSHCNGHLFICHNADADVQRHGEHDRRHWRHRSGLYGPHCQLDDTDGPWLPRTIPDRWLRGPTQDN
jgi:hypothetical protein